MKIPGFSAADANVSRPPRVLPAAVSSHCSDRFDQCLTGCTDSPWWFDCDCHCQNQYCRCTGRCPVRRCD